MSGISSSIQFKDVENVLSAFENRKVEAWSISQGKQFMFKGMGYEDFKMIVETLDNSDSTATYTVRVYEDLKTVKEIKSNTPDDGSFNFKFNFEPREESRGGNSGYSRGNENMILSKLAGIEERLNKEQEDNEEPKKTNSLGIIGEILTHPAIAPIAPRIIETFIDLITGRAAVAEPIKQLQQSQPAPIYQQNLSANVLNGMDENIIIHEAIEKLKLYDKNLASHLQKLVLIAENDNATFNIIVNSLN